MSWRVVPIDHRRSQSWNRGWILMVCEWRRWRRLGLSRWAALCILIHSLHRLH